MEFWPVASHNRASGIDVGFPRTPSPPPQEGDESPTNQGHKKYIYLDPPNRLCKVKSHANLYSSLRCLSVIFGVLNTVLVYWCIGVLVFFGHFYHRGSTVFFIFHLSSFILFIVPCQRKTAPGPGIRFHRSPPGYAIRWRVPPDDWSVLCLHRDTGCPDTKTPGAPHPCGRYVT